MQVLSEAQQAAERSAARDFMCASRWQGRRSSAGLHDKSWIHTAIRKTTRSAVDSIAMAATFWLAIVSTQVEVIYTLQVQVPQAVKPASTILR